MAKSKQKTKRSCKVRLKIGGEEREPRNVWERLLAVVLDRLPLSGELTVGEVEETEQEVELNPEELAQLTNAGEIVVVVKEDQETELRRRTQNSLEEEAKTAERKKLEAGRNPALPMPGSAAEQIDAMQSLNEKLHELRELGYKIDLPEIKPPPEKGGEQTED